MSYTVLTEKQVLSLAPDGEQGSPVEALQAALNAAEAEGLSLLTVDRPPKGAVVYVFSGGLRPQMEQRLSNLR